MRSKAFPLALVVLPLVLTGCASSGDTSSARASSPAPAASSPLPSPPSVGVPEPVVKIPNGSPPTTLQVRDLAMGSGPEAMNGSTVVVRYVGVAWSTRKVFDSSWRDGSSLPFQLGTGKVIPGWDQGIVGMRVGGRRRLTIPPDLAYGPQGYPPAIGPNETLVFVIDLEAVQ